MKYSLLCVSQTFYQDKDKAKETNLGNLGVQIKLFPLQY